MTLSQERLRRRQWIVVLPEALEQISVGKTSVPEKGGSEESEEGENKNVGHRG